MAKTPEEYLEEARKLIGYVYTSSQGRYPVEYDPIRRYLHMVDWDDPLYLDPEYAKTTKHGEMICPPSQIGNFASDGPWPQKPEQAPPPGQKVPAVMDFVPAPGERGINLRTETEWFKTVKVGDRLRSESAIVDVYIKPTRLDPKCFWIISESTIYGQNGEVVCKSRNTLIKHRRPEVVKAAIEAGEK